MTSRKASSPTRERSRAEGPEKDQYGVSFGGPIISDKLFFFASWDKQKQDITQPVDPSLADPAIAAKYPVMATGSSYVQTDDGQVAFGRLDYQFSGSQRSYGAFQLLRLQRCERHHHLAHQRDRPQRTRGMSLGRTSVRTRGCSAATGSTTRTRSG